MASAIELYQRAYHADYRQGDWEYARELYQSIIERFPHSDEAEYARVHLDRIEKLKSDPHNRELQPVRSTSGPGGLGIAAFMLIVPMIVATAFLGYFAWKSHHRHLYAEYCQAGQLNERAADWEGAVEHYRRAQLLIPDNALAYRFLAELYLGRDQLELAEVERKRWETVAPYDPDMKLFQVRLNRRLKRRVAHAP